MRYFITTIILILLSLLLFLLTTDFSKKEKVTTPNPTIVDEIIDPIPTDTKESITEAPFSDITEEKKLKFAPPLEKASERITKKKFGQFITPQNSPVQPEKFSGYHTGVDFEIFPKELISNISVSAVCDGLLKTKKDATGYGGVVVQSCEIDSQQVTIIYGHLDLASVTKEIGGKLLVGEKIGVLGADKSLQTSGERKHLHLGVHKGTEINILGYVQAKNELSKWIDPCLYFCN